ncbi:MAG TPA: hypothetical protein VL096_10130 [Pirellulaceae bacterium]|nr:hypothetical protein [Pirellulaceae bacterium]
MRDQATELRNLVLRSQRASATPGGLRLLAFASGQRDAGATDLVRKFASQCAEQGLRVVLVDEAQFPTGLAGVHWLEQLRKREQHADAVFIDAGAGPSELLQACWHLADEIVLTTTPDSAAIMETYALIKAFHAVTLGPLIQLVVRGAASTEVASDVHRRIDQSCQRFLQQRIELLGSVPSDSPQTASELSPAVAALAALIAKPARAAGLQVA